MAETIPNPTDIMASFDKMKNDDPPGQDHTFSVDWKTAGGDRLSGQFVTRILNAREKLERGLIAARVANGVSIETLDDETHQLCLMIGHLTLCLRTRGDSSAKRVFRGPDWAEDLLEIEDLALIQYIYGRALEHEAAYFRRSPGVE